MISETALFSFSPKEATPDLTNIERRLCEIDGASLPLINEGGFLIVTIEAESRSRFGEIESAIRDLLSGRLRRA